MNESKTVKLISPEGKIVNLAIETDYIMLVLAVLSLAWIKFFIDGKYNLGVINILLMYIPFGSIIHGIYYVIKKDSYFLSFKEQGYIAYSEADAIIFKAITTKTIDIKE